MTDADFADLPPDAARVFLSYSRRDRENAQRIADVLRQREFGVFRDTDDILPTEEWRGRLEELIREADTIVFLLSPHSVESEVCAWEVEFATSLNKRIAPIVIEDVQSDRIPPLLARLNFIFCTSRDPFENAVATLVAALNTDIEWIREHTRLGGLAQRWDGAGRPARLLPRGQDIADAEAWRDSRPEEAPAVTPLQADFIRESRRAAGRRQRQWVGGALAIAAATAALAVFAYFQSVEADRQRVVAEAQRARAEASAAEAERQRANAVEQRDLAEARLREALLQRARRNVADAAALLDEGRYRQSASQIAEALATATALDDASLLEASEAVARDLILDDRLFSILEGRFPEDGPTPILAIAPDGQSLIGRAREALWVWNVASGDARARAADVAAAAYRQDGQVVAIRTPIDRGGVLISIDPMSGAPEVLAETDLLVHEAWIFPYGDLGLMAGQRDGAPVLVAFKLSTGAKAFEIASPLATPRLAALSESGDTLLIAERNGEDVVAFDPTGVEIDRFAAPAKVDGLGFAYKSETALLRTDDGFWLQDLQGPLPRQIQVGDAPADDLEFIAEGQVVAHRGIVAPRLLDVETLQEIHRFEGETAFGVVGPGVDGKTVVTHGSQRFALLDVATGALKNRFGRDAPPLGGWHMSADSRYLAAVHKTGLVSVWSIAEGRETMTVMPEGGARRISILDRPEGPLVAILDDEGRIGLWLAEAGALAPIDPIAMPAPLAGGHIAHSVSLDRPGRIWNAATGLLKFEHERALIQSVDPATGRAIIDLGAQGVNLLVEGDAAPIPLKLRPLAMARLVAWGARTLAIWTHDGVARFNAETGEALPAVKLPDEAPSIEAMAFVEGDARLMLLARDGRLLEANAGGEISEAARLPDGIDGRSLLISASGRVLLIRGAKGVFRYDLATRQLEVAADPENFGTILAAGPHAAILQTGTAETRALKAIDLETGAVRFEPEWGGGAYAFGSKDRVIVEEFSNGDVSILDAKTGETIRTIAGDGGAGGFPSKPHLNAGETLLLAVNGGGEMARLIDVATGRQLAGVPRRDGFLGHSNASADLSLVTVDQSQIARVFSFGDVLRQAPALAAEIVRRYPPPIDLPEPAADADECDRLAANATDPEVRAEGVAYDRLTPEAFEVCGKLATSPDPKPRTVYLFARLATRFVPDEDANTIELLRSAGDAGHAAADHALGVLALQGRAPGGLDAAAAAFRRASEGGVGAATTTLARMADRKFISDDPEALLRAGAEAGQPFAMQELARRLAGAARYQEAAELQFRAATALAARWQRAAAANALDRAAVYARRVGAWE